MSVPCSLNFVRSSCMQGIGAGSIIRRKENGGHECVTDEVAIEEPLEIRIGNRAIATTMRTPGHDDELAAGFLLSEAIVRGREDIQAIAGAGENVINIRLPPAGVFTPATAPRFCTIFHSRRPCRQKNIQVILPPIPSLR